MKRVVTYISIVLVVGAAVLLAFQTLKKRGREYANTTQDQAAMPVAVARVALREFKEETSAVGTLKARHTSPLSPKIAGNVNAVLVDIGDRVETGQVVIRLDQTGFQLAINQVKAACEAAKAAAAQAAAQFEQAEKEYGRASSLLAEKVIPQSRFDAAQAAYKAGQEALAVAKGQYAQAKAALEIARQHFRDAEIRSPITGVVVDRNVEVGQSVGPGASVLRILDQSLVKAGIDLPGTDFGRVAVGTLAVITVDAFPEQEFPGKVTIVNPMIDRKTRTFRVRIEVPNPTGKLVDGMFARVRFSVGQKMALAVPRDALQRLPGSGTFYVFVVDKNTADKRSVKIGAIGDEFAEILDGLSQGEKVVTSGAGRLRSGTKVFVR
ncbi:MAG: efflux RND transporter periplasmic adaptor subunit [Desulfobacterales bacterium]|nr:efflux RND transporter periplasmic adaptor subunit [Desulfobacterales bacterium]